MATIGPFVLRSAPGRFELLLSHFDGKEIQFEFHTPATGPHAHLCMPGRHLVACVITDSKHPDEDFCLWEVEGPIRRVESIYEKISTEGLYRFRARFNSRTRQGTIELSD